MKHTHRDLVEIAYRWMMKNAGCGVGFMELKGTPAEIPDVLGFSSWRSVLIEVKVSRADFLRDKKKPHRAEGKGMGSFRYYCCPACPNGIIKPEELPEKWGLIYVNEKGKATCVVNPIRSSWDSERQRYKMQFEVDIHAEWQMMYTALRRLQLRGHMPEIYDSQSALERQQAGGLIPESAAIIMPRQVIREHN